jgi:hypothetical protein
VLLSLTGSGFGSWGAPQVENHDITEPGDLVFIYVGLYSVETFYLSLTVQQLFNIVDLA